jgi:hypothetical protein
MTRMGRVKWSDGSGAEDKRSSLKPARPEKLSPEKRATIAKKAAQARWSKEVSLKEHMTVSFHKAEKMSDHSCMR